MKKTILNYLNGFCIIVAALVILYAPYGVYTNINKKNQNINYTRDVYINRLESKFDASREALATEVDNYIKSVAPTAIVDALNLIDLCSEYDIDLKFVLAQGQVESHFATKGTARRTNSIFNVGAYDGHSADKQKRNGFGYKHPDYSVEPYLKLLVNDYLIDGKTEMDLLNKYVNKDGKRYASASNYEQMLQSCFDRLTDSTNIDAVYNEYKMYKMMLGR